MALVLAVGAGLGYAGRGWVSPSVKPVAPVAPAVPAVAPVPAVSPVPTPTITPLYAVLIFDPADPSQQTIADSPSLARALFDRVGSYRQRPVNDPSVRGTIWGQAVAKAGGPPCVLWVRQDATIESSAKVSNEADVLASIPDGE